MASAPDTPEDDKIRAREIWNEGIFFLPAAGDTTSIALSVEIISIWEVNGSILP